MDKKRRRSNNQPSSKDIPTQTPQSSKTTQRTPLSAITNVNVLGAGQFPIPSNLQNQRTPFAPVTNGSGQFLTPSYPYNYLTYIPTNNSLRSTVTQCKSVTGAQHHAGTYNLNSAKAARARRMGILRDKKTNPRSGTTPRGTQSASRTISIRNFINAATQGGIQPTAPIYMSNLFSVLPYGTTQNTHPPVISPNNVSPCNVNLTSPLIPLTYLKNMVNLVKNHSVISTPTSSHPPKVMPLQLQKEYKVQQSGIVNSGQDTVISKKRVGDSILAAKNKNYNRGDITLPFQQHKENITTIAPGNRMQRFEPPSVESIKDSRRQAVLESVMKNLDVTHFSQSVSGSNRGKENVPPIDGPKVHEDLARKRAEIKQGKCPIHASKKSTHAKDCIIPQENMIKVAEYDKGKPKTVNKDSSKVRARKATAPIPVKEKTKFARQVRKDKLNGVAPPPSAYWDIGDPTYECEHCHALFWFEERTPKQTKNNPKFNLCCNKGQVKLPLLQQPPQLLQDLLENRHEKSKNYIENIRTLNSMFAFTSMGGTIDKEVNKGRGPYSFRMGGQNIHRIGPMMPKTGDAPQYAQLYIYDTQNEADNRLKALSGSGKSGLDQAIVEQIKNMMDEHNPYAKVYRMARDRLSLNNSVEIRLQLIGRRQKDGRTYNLPTASEVAAVIEGDIENAPDKRDIVLEKQSGFLKHIDEFMPCYLPLQYPLLFAYGEDGWYTDIPKNKFSKRPNLTLREFLAFRIQDRVKEGHQLLHGRRLFQQFLVDSYIMMESQRLKWLRHNQPKLKVDSYKNLTHAIDEGLLDTSQKGQLTILPSTFTGGRRWFDQMFQDSMAICKWTGYPCLFITFTCNPKWPEITRYVESRGLRPEDRPDILCRVFKIKLDEFVSDLKDKHMFGKPKALIYMVEFQKRGLPHAHILLFLNKTDEARIAGNIDDFICAELPDEESDPELYEAVKDYMVHGPCGADNPHSPCMVNNRCSKMFPKSYNERTFVDEKGYHVYRRRDNGATVDKNGIILDSRYVVPYNAKLLLKYRAHINVESCNQSRSIKYLFKYIAKGSDMTGVKFVGERDDEIKKYESCRYVSACEAIWRIFSFDLHYRTPAVERLSFHLEDEQGISFKDGDYLPDLVNKPTVKQSKFLQWMEINKTDPEAQKLTYAEFPREYVWNGSQKIWSKRKTKQKGIGRMYNVPMKSGRLYYMRLMLNHVKGATCFADIRTVDGIVYDTYKAACESLGLLFDDGEYVAGITEASHWATAYHMRQMFAMLLLSNSMSKPEDVWAKTWQFLSEDILHTWQKESNNPALVLSDHQIKNLALAEIEKLLKANGSSLHYFDDMPKPDGSVVSDATNQLILDELSYDRVAMQSQHAELYTHLTDEQRNIYEKIMSAVDGGRGGVFFLYGYGGTGKTFIWRTLCSGLRGRGDIVLPVASSGIASLLLPKGRTAHSRFGIPIKVHEDSTCTKIKPDSDVTGLLKRTSLIIWDEAPMAHKHCYEALDRSLKYVLQSYKPFGGLVIVFGGDFRQILPVVPKGSRHDIVNAAICSSKLWSSCEVLRLTKNMRLQAGTSSEEIKETKEFAEWILQVGDGVAGGQNDGEVNIKLPEDIIIRNANNPIATIVESTYPSLLDHLQNPSVDPDYFHNRAVLAPTNDIVDNINDYVMSLMPGNCKEYLSADSISQDDSDIGRLNDVFSVEFLNTIKCSGLPNHRIVLKVGCMVMLLRNIDPSMELCNGTRLIVKKLAQNVIEAETITGKNRGQRVLIPRMIMSPSDVTKFPIEFDRRQFPLSVCFAMTINKSQGQSLGHVGLYLPSPVFSHGQLYVAFSRVTNKKGLKVLICDKDGETYDTTTNVVYKEVFDKL
ncbi:hypothetical protein OROMI_014176 [Orobanche minor]